MFLHQTSTVMSEQKLEQHYRFARKNLALLTFILLYIMLITLIILLCDPVI